jgi:hypothetical protein
MRKKIFFLGRIYYEVRCHCYKARSLIASDETGLSDPYLSITVGNETQTTPVNNRILVRFIFCSLGSQTIFMSTMEYNISFSTFNACWRSRNCGGNYWKCCC